MNERQKCLEFSGVVAIFGSDFKVWSQTYDFVAYNPARGSVNNGFNPARFQYGFDILFGYPIIISY